MRRVLLAALCAVLVCAAVCSVSGRHGIQRAPTAISVRLPKRGGGLRSATGRRGRATESRSNGAVIDTAVRRSIVGDWIGQGWISVPFGAQNTPTNKIFTLHAARAVLVEAVDLFCMGDAFRIVAELQSARPRVYEMYTSNVVADGCSLTTPDADEAFASGQWSRGQFELPRGSYILTVYAHSSPYGGGSMAIRARYK